MRRGLAASGLALVCLGFAVRRCTAPVRLSLDPSYTIPEGTEKVTLQTGLGEVELVPARGWFGGQAIFISLPGKPFEEVYRVQRRLAAAFLAATGGNFRIEIEGECSLHLGGTEHARAVISAGIDEDAYFKSAESVGESRKAHCYFQRNSGPYPHYCKNSGAPVPHLNEIARIVERLIDPGLVNDLRRATCRVRQTLHPYLWGE